MAHSKADIAKAVGDYTAAHDKLKALLLGVVASMDNSRRAAEMVLAAPLVSEAFAGRRDEDAPTSGVVGSSARGFVHNLTEKLAAAGNGHA